jgi:hypothetical protein
MYENISKYFEEKIFFGYKKHRKISHIGTQNKLLLKKIGRLLETMSKKK